MKLYIRNMACESCKVVVKDELKKMGLHCINVELGEAEVKEKLNEKQQHHFDSVIKKVGLELVKNKDGILIDKVKASIAEYIQNTDHRVKLSNFLAKKLNMDYGYIANYFSAMQASTIEQFMIALKIEKVKELLVLEDLTISEIAYRLNYSSVAHLSSQFKKVTGLPASHFKKLKGLRRKTMQEV